MQLVSMSTRKIKLSQKFTLRFRDITLPDADAVAELLNDDPDQGSSADETFNSLPDLFPDIFQSQTKSSVPTLDLSYSIGDCSTYKLWESCTADVIPLASQSEAAACWLLTGMLTSGGTDNGVHHNDSESDLHCHVSDCATRATKISFRENLRRVQAFSPHTSILDIEKDLELDSPSARETLQSVHAQVTCEAVIEYDRQPNSLEIDGDKDETCVDSYLLLEEDMTNESQLEDFTLADENAPCSRLSSSSEIPHILQVLVDNKHPEVKKSIRKRKSTYLAANYYSLELPKEFRKQKRSTPRRGRPPGSTNLVRKMRWLSDTPNDHLECDQGTETVANLQDDKENKVTKTRRFGRKTVSVSTVSILSSDPPLTSQNLKLQRTMRRGRRKIQSGA